MQKGNTITGAPEEQATDSPIGNDISAGTRTDVIADETADPFAGKVEAAESRNAPADETDCKAASEAAARTQNQQVGEAEHGPSLARPPHAIAMVLLAVAAVLLAACVAAAFGIDRWSLATVALLALHVLASVVYLTAAIWGISLLAESIRVLARFDLRKGETPRVGADGLGGTLLGSFGILALTNLTLRTETLFGMDGTGEWVPYWSAMGDAGHLVSRVAPARFAFLGSAAELGMVVWGIAIAACLGAWMLVRRSRSSDGRFHIPHTAPMGRFLAAKRCVDAFACKDCLTVADAGELRRYVGLFSEAWERDVNEAQGKHTELTMSEEVREMLDGTRPVPSEGVALYGYGYNPNLQVSRSAAPGDCRRFSEFDFEPGSYAAYHVGHQARHRDRK